MHERRGAHQDAVLIPLLGGAVQLTALQMRIFMNVREASAEKLRPHLIGCAAAVLWADLGVDGYSRHS